MATINWQREILKASSMSTEQLRGALRDIRETLPGADACDRECGTDNGGFYRDQASVYRSELRARGVMYL